MTREELKSAGETLRSASEGVSDETLRDGLAEQADQFATLADADQETADAIESALEDIRAYRSTIEGV